MGSLCDCPFLFIQKKRLRPSISVTPGIPPIAETKSDRALIGKVTPVNVPVRFTAKRVSVPIAIESAERLNGCLLFPI